MPMWHAVSEKNDAFCSLCFYMKCHRGGLQVTTESWGHLILQFHIVKRQSLLKAVQSGKCLPMQSCKVDMGYITVPSITILNYKLIDTHTHIYIYMKTTDNQARKVSRERWPTADFVQAIKITTSGPLFCSCVDSMAVNTLCLVSARD